MSESKSASVVFTNGSLLAKNAQNTADIAKTAAEIAQEQAGGAQKTADGKNSVYRGSDPSTVPTTGLKEGDLYFTSNALYTWNGSAWEETVSDTTGAEIHAKVDAAMQESQKSVADLQADVEAKVKKLDDEIAQNKIQTGNALNFYKEQYYLSTSYTELAGGSWSDEVPGKEAGKYVWSRYVTANIGNSTNYQYSDPVCISGLDGEQGPQGPTGATGPQGPQGVTGAKGADGQTTYVHVAYANSADGNANFSVNYFADALYVGVLTDYTQADSNDYTKYTWSRLKGDTGTSFKLFTTNYTYSQNEIDSYSGTGYSGTWSVNESTSELRVGDTVQLRCTNSSKAGYSFIIAKVTAIPGDKLVTCVSSGLIDKGDTGDQGIPGPKGVDGQTTYVHFAYSNSADGKSNFNTSYFSDALYVGTYTDYTQTDSNDYTQYTWSRLKGDTGQTGATGATGPQGPQGVAGAKGADGQTTYVHVAYANSSDGESDFNTSYFSDALYVGVLTDNTQADSNDYTKYTWSRLKGDTGATGPQGLQGPVGPKGDTGNQGIPGPKGIDGQTTYVHFAYANSADGNINFNTSYFADALYVGTYTDYTPTDSNDYTKYTWSRLKGDTGTSFKLFTTNYTYSQNEIDSYSVTGYSGTWSVNESTSELRVGDTVQLRCTNSSKAGYSFIIAKVTAIPGDKLVTCVSSGLIDKGDIGPTGATGAKGDTGSTGFFIGTTPPLNPTVGTVWATNDSSGNMVSAKTWNGSSWVSTAFTQDLVAGNITASKIVGGELDVNKITVKNAQNIPIESTVSLGKKLSDIKQDADGLLLTVKNGGQNLLSDTDTMPGWSGDKEKVDNFTVVKAVNPNTNGAAYDPIAWNGLTCIKPNTDYTLTFYAKADQNGVLIYSYLYNIGTNSVYKDGSTANTLTTSYQRYEIHFHTEDFSDGRTVNCLPMRIVNPNVACYIYGVQLEEGTIATAWSPSPSDVSALKITADGLNAYINGSNGSDNLKAILHMDPNNSVIAQMVNGNPVAAINLSKEGKVQIDGSHISLNAATTIPDATIKSGMIESLSADKLTAGTIDASQIMVINLDANNITTGTLSAVVNDLSSFQTYILSSSNPWNFDYTNSVNGNWFLIGEIDNTHVYNGPPISPYMYVTSRGTSNGSSFTVTVWKDNDPTQYQRVWSNGSWSQWVRLSNSQNIVSTINLSKEDVKISGEKIELDGNIELNGSTKVTGRLDLIQKDQDAVGQSSSYHNPWNWAHAHIYFDNYLQLQGENCGVVYTNDNSSLNEGRNFYSLATLTPGYLKFTTYQNKVSDVGEDFSGQISRTYIDSSRIEAGDVWAGNLRIVGHHIRPADDKFVLVSNHAGTNFDNNGSVGFQVYGGVGLGQNTIYTATTDLYIQRGNTVQTLGQRYSDANKTTIHAQNLISQVANSVSSRLSVKTDITPVTYDRALAAVEGTEMYDYRYTSDDTGQHYVSGIIDDVNPTPQYHMDGMLINKERTARIDANLLGYHHVIIQKLLERVTTLEITNQELLDRVATLEEKIKQQIEH